jgi:hypothetical protein
MSKFYNMKMKRASHSQHVFPVLLSTCLMSSFFSSGRILKPFNQRQLTAFRTLFNYFFDKSSQSWKNTLVFWREGSEFFTLIYNWNWIVLQMWCAAAFCTNSRILAYRATSSYMIWETWTQEVLYCIYGGETTEMHQQSLKKFVTYL